MDLDQKTLSKHLTEKLDKKPKQNKKKRERSESESYESETDSEEEEKDYNPIQRYRDEKPLVIKRDQIQKVRIIPEKVKPEDKKEVVIVKKPFGKSATITKLNAS